jgi:hypothetical protein
LLVYLAQLAVREKCARFQWQVLDWNRRSIEFYESLGARMMKEWLTMRVEGQALVRLAEAYRDGRAQLEPNPVGYAT